MRITTTPLGSRDRPTWMTTTLEVAGGILVWELDSTEPTLHLWNLDDATWLWRIVGEQRHVDTVASLASSTHTDADVADTDELELLCRLAWGHWLRRWWPTSVADGIDALSGVVLDLEVALLTEDCEAYFDADSFDGDAYAVLAGRDDEEIDSLATHYRAEVRELHRRWLLRDAGVAIDDALEAARSEIAADYALAAGPSSRAAPSGGIARGRASLAWETVPANVFDAAEDTVSWSVDAAPDVVADVRVALLPGRSAAEVNVELSLPDPPMHARATLSRAGSVRIPLPLSAAQAWSADWSTMECVVGAPSRPDARYLRDQVRALIRRRIDGSDATPPLFVAEQLAADSDY
ncbi:hypothetical protein HH308_23270 [Gordonia sp. TBRC 11910]|uniref:Uncharacterized protein n=1 Tax=Gordonia asplenii TaxID=2725283 RepID=A0A848L6I3_9ACTN|nr:hypothetical protein [Gordonia asplenii]NMO04141.1 hypothetical protein [Gordonia asplenii]